MLIILDSCEHVIDPAALLAQAILNDAPGVGILATSREPLRVGGEYVHRLAPLALPPETARITSARLWPFSTKRLGRRPHPVTFGQTPHGSSCQRCWTELNPA